MVSGLFSLTLRVFFTGVHSSWTNSELAVLNIGHNALQGGGLRENLQKFGTLVIGYCVMTRSQVIQFGCSVVFN